MNDGGVAVRRGPGEEEQSGIIHDPWDRQRCSGKKTRPGRFHSGAGGEGVQHIGGRGSTSQTGSVWLNIEATESVGCREDFV